ncbi:O-antigen ligase family protein [Rugosimonospora acidiphila]|uniref:O-antigen ligase family protein n=1 Tax=Rugosimonospora acidiphila TaxID=556531 RepID=UPI0031EA845D
MVEGIKTLIAAGIAVALAAFAVTLPGITWRGAVVGTFFAGAGISTWTFTNQPIFIWGILAIEGVVFAFWTWPWHKSLRDLPRMGGAWLGLPYWVFGVIGAVLVAHVVVAGERVAYAGVFALSAMGVMAAAKRPRSQGGGDPSVGIVAAILVAISLLMLAGSGSMFDSVHAIPPHNYGALDMKDRFWGGNGLFFQPNALAGLMIVASLRIAPDRAFAWWQRLAATGFACFVLVLTNSRTPWGVAVVAALIHALMVWRWRRADLPTYKRPWVAVLTPLVMLGIVLAISGGSGFIVKTRFATHNTSTTTTTAPPSTASNVTSGRTDTWKQVLKDWEHASVAEKIFGDAKTSRAVVTRANDPGVELNTDNAAVGAFRRGGVLGILAFVFGVLLVVWHALIRRPAKPLPPAWFTIAAVALVPSIALEDWLLGGTNGGIWIILLAGEASLLWSPATRAVTRPITANGMIEDPKTLPGRPAQVSAPGLS